MSAMIYAPRCTPKDISEFLAGYLDCAEWCGLDEERRYEFELSVSPRWSEAALAVAKRDCEDFRENWHPVWEAAGMSDSQAGHDFWLTRNRHGAGFWDRGIGEAGTRLTEAAHAWGDSYVEFDSETEELEFV